MKSLHYEICQRLHCGLIVIDAQGIIIWFNEAAQALLGDQLIGATWFAIKERSFVSRANNDDEVSLVDGRRISIAISALNNLSGELITLTDLTITRQHEQEKAEYGRFLALGRMTAQLAHQIRTPLSSAIIYTEHLANGKEVEERRAKWITQIQTCHASIEKQIEDLLLFARGGEAIELTRIAMYQWGKELERRIHSLILPATVNLVIDNQLAAGFCYLHTESLIGAVLNLITNAIQAKASNIALSLSYIKNNLVISVRDNGCGMTEEIKGQAFAPFFTTKAKGTGLGLAVVKAIVKAHHGNVELKSSPGQGCDVKINLSP